MLEELLDLAGTAGAVVGAVLLIVLGRLILNKAISDKRTLPYHRQFLTLVVSLVGLFLAIALLPIEATVRAQILSAIGILISAVIALSATTLVGNAMAGIMLRLMRSFRPGDFVAFQDTIGRITDISLFHTEVQTVTRDIVAVPNSVLARTAVHVTRRDGTFISATVSIGYSDHHSRVEAALKRAAEHAKLEEPFVFVDELLDHAVRYRVYALLPESHERISRSSDLRRAILDILHEEGIEIASPSLVNRRELPADHVFAPGRDAAAKTGEGESGIEDLAFDRAEQAESIEKLRTSQEKLAKELEDLKADGEGSDRRERVKEQMGRIEEEISRREKEREEQRLEEDTEE